MKFTISWQNCKINIHERESNKEIKGIAATLFVSIGHKQHHNQEKMVVAKN